MDQITPTSERLSPTIELASQKGEHYTQIDSSDLRAQESSKLAIAAKFLLVAFLVAGLAAATVFSSGSAIAMIGAGAVAWKIGFVSVAAIMSLITLMGSVYYATKDQMFKDSGENKKDSLNYVGDTFLTAVTVFTYGLNFFKNLVIFSKDK